MATANSQLVQTPVGVEKLDLSEKRPELGDRKCLGEQRKSFIGHPNAKLIFADFSEVSFLTATGDYTNNPGQ
jgi:hypothetical protein